jgi:type IV secretory pathway VirB3-like protein
MPAPEDETVPWESLAVGATRPAVIRGLNVPFWFLIPVVGLPILLTAATHNPFWLVGIGGLTVLARWLVAGDHNRPRVLYLALMSGSMFADRRRWGGHSVDPLGGTRHGRD